jgi:sigma-B regulation protein RsbU (phosphoserine phosphatase)
MSSTGGAAPAASVSSHPVPEFVCAEIWGGNRPINAPVELPGIQGWVFSQPCQGGRGGDIHYLSICSSGLISRVCLADVAGHGQAVALVSDEIHRLLRRYMNNFDERRVLADLNARLTTSPEARMTTAATASYFPPLRALSLSYAGHPPAWLYRRRADHWSRMSPPTAGNRERRLVDLPLAIDPQTAFSRRKARVSVGDRLLLVTDGVLEAPAPNGELYGDARLEQLLEHNRQASVPALAKTILDSVVAHTGDPTLSHDDVTLLLVEIVRGPRALGVWELIKNRVLGRRRRVHAAGTG